MLNAFGEHNRSGTRVAILPTGPRMVCLKADTGRVRLHPDPVNPRSVRLPAGRRERMKSRAWAWLLALIALVLVVIPIAAMGRLFGLAPMSVAVSNSLWLAAIVLTIVSFVMSLRQGLRTRL